MLAYRSFFPLRLAISALGFLAWVTTAARGMDFQPVSAAELTMTSEPRAAGAPAIILFREVDRDDGGFHEDVYYRIKVLTEEGRKYADVEIPYLTSELKIKNLHARSIRPDGSIRNFDGNILEKTIVKARGVKYRAITFALSDVVAGGIIEYFYTIEFRQHFVYDSGWILDADLFTKSAKFSLRPAMYAVGNLHIVSRNLPSGVQPVVTPSHIVELEIDNLPAFHIEDFMPPENELKARVDFVYSQWSANSPDQFWSTFGRECYRLLEDFIGRPKAMEQAVAGIVSPGDGPELKAEKIYDAVQQLRNLSFEEEKSAQEEKREKARFPKNAEEVWKLKRGTGVQLTWLYVALARAAGLEVYGVWVAERSSSFFTPSTMDSYRLDTNVALLRINGRDLFLDPGSAFVPFGMLPWSESGVSGYKIDKNDSGGWIKTTLPSSSQSQVRRKADLKLAEDGDLEGKVSVTFTGLESASRRAEERFSDDAHRKEYLEDELKDSIPIASEVELTNHPEWQGSSPSMIAEFAIRIPAWAAIAGRRMAMPIGVFSKSESHLFIKSEREHPIYIAYPFQHVDEIIVAPPVGWQTLSAPPSQKNDKHVAVYGLQTEPIEKSVHFTRNLALDFMLLETTSYPVLRDFFQSLRTVDEQQIVFERQNSSSCVSQPALLPETKGTGEGLERRDCQFRAGSGT